MVSAYFKTLRLSLNIEKNNSWKVKIGEALDNYADAWDALNFIPGAGPILAPALKAVSKAGGKKLSKVINSRNHQRFSGVNDETVRLIQFKSLAEMQKALPTEKKCLAYLEKTLWPNGVESP